MRCLSVRADGQVVDIGIHNMFLGAFLNFLLYSLRFSNTDARTEEAINRDETPRWPRTPPPP